MQLTIDKVVGKIIEIDLSNKEYDIYELEEDLFYKRIGGRGLGLEFVKKYKDSVVIARGILSKVPGIPGRATAYFISPITRGIFYSSSGGNIHFMEPYAIVIKGKSENKIYLNIENNKVEFLDAKEIFDLDRYETFKYLENKHKNKIILAIGNSKSLNENLMNNKHGFFGRGGSGYIFREKNLKAIVIEVNREFSARITDEYKRLMGELIISLKRNKIINELTNYGTVGMLLKELGERNMLPIEIDYKKYLEAWKNFEKRNNACLGCPIACKKNFEFWGGFVSFYSKGFKSFEEIDKEYEKYNKLGLDAVFNEYMACVKSKVYSLALATSNRGDQNQLVLTKLFRENLDLKDEEIVDYVIEMQNKIALLDSLVVCGFTLYAWDLDVYSRILNSLGFSFTEENLYKIGENIYNEEIKLNRELGFKYKEDYTDPRLLEEYYRRRKLIWA